MAADQDSYWDSRGVPKLPADVLKLGKSQRRAWRIRYLQDLYIPDGLDAEQEKTWRQQHSVQVLTGHRPKSTAVPLRGISILPQSASDAKNTNISQPGPLQASNARATGTSQAAPSKVSNTRKISTLLVTPSSAPGFTRLCVALKKQWHNSDGSVWQPSKPPSAVKHVSNDAQTTNRQLQDVFIHPPAKRQKTGHVIYPSATERRLSSIPGNLGWSNGAETFKRMAAIVDQSDSEVSDSSSDDEEAVRPVAQGSFAESFADRINEGSPKVIKASPNSQLRATLEEAIVLGSIQALDKQERSPPLPKAVAKMLEIASRSELVSSPSAQESQANNTRMHDAISISSDAKLGGEANPHFRLGKSSSPCRIIRETRNATNFNLDIEESTQEVYEAVEEILEDVCSSTRSLPPSTSTTPQLEKDPLITIYSSPHIKLVLEPMTEQHDEKITRGDNAESSDDESMAEVGEEAGEHDMDGISTGSTSDARFYVEGGQQDRDGVSIACTSDAGSSIMVAMRNTREDRAVDEDKAMKGEGTARRRASLNSKSSSSILEQLSRSPTPPPFALGSPFSTTRRTSQRKRETQVDVAHRLPPSPRIIVTKVPDSRRKITGVTSKHFSRSKLSMTDPRTERGGRGATVEIASQPSRQTLSQSPLNSTFPSKFTDDFDDDEDEDEIDVAPRRRLTWIGTSPNDETGEEQQHSTSRRPQDDGLWGTALSKQKIAYVDLTRPTSQQSTNLKSPSPRLPIAYVDLTGDPSILRVPATQNSPPNDKDERLDHLAKLLKSPNFAKKESGPADIARTDSINVARKDDTNTQAPGKPNNPERTLKTPKRTTGTKSPHFITDRVDLYNTTSSSRRVPAGTSTVPIPPLTSSAFGIIQEKLWKEPFWLLIAVTFLNKTTGRAAVPIFWKVKKLFPTPEQLAEADPAVLLDMVKSLGLQNARSKRLVTMAQAWVASPPVKGWTYRTLNYPTQGDGRAREVQDVVEDDIEICKGTLEIGQMPGCGAYAYDSWRIFCRDVFRGMAEDYDGKGAVGEGEEGVFEAEWKRVLPGDKELRACLRWMWMREGWVWNPLTGEKMVASSAELEMAANGEMHIEDEGERKFARMVVGLEVSSPVKGVDAGDMPY